MLNQLKEMLKNEVSVIMLATDLNSAAEAAAIERCIVEGADSYILKPPAPRELTALWGFVARKRQQASETEKLHDLNQVIRSVEDEIGTQQKRARSVAQLKAHNAEKAATPDKPAATPNAMPNPMWAQSKADPKPEQSFKKSSPTKKVVKWSMHEQFEEDLKADLADAHRQCVWPRAAARLPEPFATTHWSSTAQIEFPQIETLQSKSAPRWPSPLARRVLPEYGIGVNSAIFNPALEGAVDNCVTQLLGIMHPGDTPKGDKKGVKGDKKSCVECAPSSSTSSSAGVPVDRAGRLGVESESDASFGPREGKDGKLAQPEKRKLRKGDSGNLRAMLLERRQSSVGRSSKELLTMLSILDGNEEDDGMEDELVLCRICEQQVLRSSLQLHTAICKATHKAKNDEEKATKEVKELLGLLQSTRRQALLSLMSIAVQRFNLMCAPLDKLQELGGQLLHNDDTNLSPLHHLGRLTELARELAMLKRAGGTEMGGSVFYSCASQLKAIIADKISNVQELIDLDPHALDFGATRPLNRGMAITGKLGIRDFKLIRMLATGGFAQVWLAKKKSTGDVMAIKAMRKEHLRDTDQVTSINVEHAILAKHDCEFLVRAFYSFRSAHHIYFALEYMPGGDLSSMLAECGCIAEPSAAFYVAETLLGMHYLHTKHILHRDIKPSNVLIAESGHIKLADFGLSTSMMQHKKCGTLPYVAPEVLRDGSASEALDYWAVGVLLYELTVGEPPFSGETPKLMLNAIMNTTINTQPLSPVASSLVRSLLQVDPALRLGASGIEEIQAHAFFAFTRWDKMMEATPPFVPQLAGGDDDAYFPHAFKADHDIDIDSDTSEEDPDDCGESFKQIQSVNVDHLISLARRPSSKALKAGQSVLTTPTDSTRDSTPVQSVPATPQQQPRSLKSPKPKPPPSKGDLSKLSLSQLSQQQQQLEEQLSKLTKGDLGKVSQQQQQQLELHVGTKLKGPVSRPL